MEIPSKQFPTADLFHGETILTYTSIGASSTCHMQGISRDQNVDSTSIQRLQSPNMPHHFDITTLAHSLDLRCCAAGGLEMTGNAPAGIGIDVPSLGHLLMFRGFLASGLFDGALNIWWKGGAALL